MRRPAPIAVEDERPKTPDAAAATFPSAAPVASEPTHAPVGADDETAPIDPIGLPPREGGIVPEVAAPEASDAVSAADLWRAARARRKALRAEIRRFTSRTRRRRLIWLGAGGAVLLLVLGTAAAAYSPLFAVEDITVAGARSVDPQSVEDALSDQLGKPLALIDDSEVKAALVGFPLIETYAVEVKPPHELVVRIVERTPIGVIRSGAGYTLVDAAGIALATTDARPKGQPLLTVAGGVDTPAFESAGLVVRSLPAEIRKALTGVQAKTPDDVTLALSGDRSVMWGSAEESALKAATLSKLMAKNPKSSHFDVSSPSVPVVG